ncbi:phage tail tube protein [Advenella mimigardefordensis]|uniref:phage tail tube protein n=1 Tax=Advenella mimigardefordensis TaxID=302406 RepID=UPI00046CEE43|nr:phage tail tube protein [Advenella mimigardefordensis]
MSVLAQGTDFYAIDPADGSLIDVGCITSLNGIDDAIDQIETTCLQNKERTYRAGLSTPGTATFGLQIDPANEPDHVRLHQLKKEGATIRWAVGWSDGTAAPTVGSDSSGNDIFVLPTTRTWLTFEGYMSSFPFAFETNAVVSSEVGIQISGPIDLLPKTTS